jgi:uncharacterized repeat protein (TIGR04076 family)
LTGAEKVGGVVFEIENNLIELIITCGEAWCTCFTSVTIVFKGGQASSSSSGPSNSSQIKCCCTDCSFLYFKRVRLDIDRKSDPSRTCIIAESFILGSE